jgi:hypothetical protein
VTASAVDARAGGRHSGIGNRITRFPVFCPAGKQGGNPRFPIWPGNRESSFPDSAAGERESGSRFGGPGISKFLVWAGAFFSAGRRGLVPGSRSTNLKCSGCHCQWHLGPILGPRPPRAPGGRPSDSQTVGVRVPRCQKLPVSRHQMLVTVPHPGPPRALVRAPRLVLGGSVSL